MDVPTWVWFATVGSLGVLFALELVIVERTPHEMGLAEAVRWMVFSLACAAMFGLGVWRFAGGDFAVKYFAGYLTEYSLSVDNLFLFVVMMSAFRVPAVRQHRILMVGVALALILRGLFIAAGATLISHFSSVFYLFGVLLIGLGWRQLRQRRQHGEVGENIVPRPFRRLIPVTEKDDGSPLTVTPIIMVMIAIGSVDVVFALDSIPAIFGLTREPFLVFTANAFALMGLRQIYFIIGRLLARLGYLSVGLGLILGFIGVKLVLDALRENSLPFLNDGQPLHSVPTAGSELSLGVIVGVLLVTTVASVLRTRGHRRGSQPARPGVISSR
jgi:tellurite resistance protein TerC